VPLSLLSIRTRSLSCHMTSSRKAVGKLGMTVDGIELGQASMKSVCPLARACGYGRVRSGSSIRAAPQLGQAHSGSTQLSARQRLRDYVRQHRTSFVDLRPAYTEVTTRQDIVDCAGYIAMHKGVLEYLFSDTKLTEIAGGPAEATALKRELAAAGMIGKTKGSGWNRYVVKRPIGFAANGKPHRTEVVAIPDSALAG
jgi:hypothetical protein